MGRARRAQPRSGRCARPHGLHVRARPVLAAGQLDRGQREHERRRAPLPGLRRHQRPRPGARCRAGRRLEGPARQRGASVAPATTSAASSSVRRERSGSSRPRACGSPRSPPAVRTMLLDFERVHDCAATVSAIVARGVVPAALEMMDRGIVRAVERFAHAGYPTDAAAVLLVEVDGLEAGVEAQAREVEAAAREHGVGTVRVAVDDAERALLWKGRKSAFGAIAQIAPHYHLHDCVVPRTKLAEVLAGVYAIAKHHDLIVTNVFHAGDGNLHPLFSFDLSVPGTLDRVLAAADELVRLCIDAGGALSGEHGIGLEKRDFMPLVFTDGGSERAGMCASGVRSRRADESAEGAAGRRALRRLRGRSVGARRRAAGGHMDLIHPHTAAEVADATRVASAEGIRLLGGRRTPPHRQGEPRRGRRRAVDDVAGPADRLRPGGDAVRRGGGGPHPRSRRVARRGWSGMAGRRAGRRHRRRGDRGRRRASAAAAGGHAPRHRGRDARGHRRRPTCPLRRPHRQERDRLRSAPAADRVAGHARRDHAGRPEGAAAAEGRPDLGHRGGRRGARTPDPRDGAAARRGAGLARARGGAARRLAGGGRGAGIRARRPHLLPTTTPDSRRRCSTMRRSWPRRRSPPLACLR